MEVVAAVPDVPGGRERSLAVVAVVPDVFGGSGRSLEVVTVVPDVLGGIEGRWKWPRSLQTFPAAAEGR